MALILLLVLLCLSNMSTISMKLILNTDLASMNMHMSNTHEAIVTCWCQFYENYVKHISAVCIDLTEDNAAIIPVNTFTTFSVKWQINFSVHVITEQLDISIKN